MRLQASGQGVDVAFVVVVFTDEAQLGHPPRAACPVEDRVADAARGGRGVLRVQRQHQYPRGPGRPQAVQRARHRRLAVAHGPLGVDLMTPAQQGIPDRTSLARRPHRQRRPLGCPDAAVLGGRLRRADVEDDAVQDRPPGQAWDLDDPRITQELGQIGPQRSSRRGGGSSEVDQQHAGSRGRAMPVGRLRVEGHGPAIQRNSGCGNPSCAPCGWVSPKRSTSNRTQAAPGSVGEAPSPTTPLPCSVQLPRRRLTISPSLKRT